MPDVLQLQSMLWHAWISINSQAPLQTTTFTRAQVKRKRSRATARAQEDNLRRKRQKQEVHEAASGVVYKCPHQPCKREKSFVEFEGVFTHL